MNKADMETFLEKAKNTGEKVAGVVVDKTKVVADKTVEVVDGISDKIEEKKEAEQEKRRLYKENAMQPLMGTGIEAFIESLGESPCELSDTLMKKAKRNFPIPKEQNILWFDAEFDLRPSGIVATDKGIYIRTDVSVFEEKIKKRFGKSNYGCQTAHCGRYIPHFDFGAKPSPIVPYRHLPQSLSGMTADCRSLV